MTFIFPYITNEFELLRIMKNIGTNKIQKKYNTCALMSLVIALIIATISYYLIASSPIRVTNSLLPHLILIISVPVTLLLFGIFLRKVNNNKFNKSVINSHILITVTTFIVILAALYLSQLLKTPRRYYIFISSTYDIFHYLPDSNTLIYYMVILYLFVQVIIVIYFLFRRKISFA